MGQALESDEPDGESWLWILAPDWSKYSASWSLGVTICKMGNQYFFPKARVDFDEKWFEEGSDTYQMKAT